MANSQLRDNSASASSLTGFVGGGLLLASVVVTVISQPALFAYIGLIGPALFAAALLVFAFGVRGVGSVTARRPVGTTALVLLAFWLFLGSVQSVVISDFFSNDPAPTLLMAFSYADSYVQFALALVAVMQIARIGAVPSPFNWVPAWAVGAATATWLLSQLLGAGLATLTGPNLVVWVLIGLDGLVRIGGMILLGVIAIVLADRVNRSTVAAPPLIGADQV
ncbi:hypothetical protein SAMN05216368_10969 [Cryobacterium flavum]|uniref:Uncharacterized protein n=1 Tax=Cryobacterium flavum TaxID=1424659 RepID=A0A4R8V2M5_9MICO|nr:MULTISPECIES: hypothetical protein [Cryobacterium]TFB76056.1 hypothetical protein E3O21_11405 [Cryobacterium flavum]SDO02163.1 hypothetical protein SAMN05216368_10969 [Cryobacterium flavum]